MTTNYFVFDVAGHPLLDEKKVWIAAISDSPKPPPCRITMTFPVINNAHCCAFAMAGQGKADMVKVASNSLLHYCMYNLLFKWYLTCLQLLTQFQVIHQWAFHNLGSFYLHSCCTDSFCIMLRMQSLSLRHHLPFTAIGFETLSGQCSVFIVLVWLQMVMRLLQGLFFLHWNCF